MNWCKMLGHKWEAGMNKNVRVCRRCKKREGH